MTPTPDNPAPAPRSFRAADRLTHDRQYKAVYDTRIRKVAGPLSLSAKPNSVGRHRLGLAVPRKAGSAPKRNRIKRMIREAFRLTRERFPAPPSGGYDLVVGVRAHELPKADPGMEYYRDLLIKLAGLVHREWRSRFRDDRPEPKP
ncbi:MAG: ribonuclease P protein component [Phycisphaerales bacterium]|nr:ribonuclease P protein component [Phycisphaerales bacterium]